MEFRFHINRKWLIELINGCTALTNTQTQMNIKILERFIKTKESLNTILKTIKKNSALSHKSWVNQMPAERVLNHQILKSTVMKRAAFLILREFLNTWLAIKLQMSDNMLTPSMTDWCLISWATPLVLSQFMELLISQKQQTKISITTTFLIRPKL